MASVKQVWHDRPIFDVPRHKTIMHLPLDWPRISQFPEWWTVTGDGEYSVREATPQLLRTCTGKQLRDGILIDLWPGITRCLYVHAPGK